jgi:adenosylmethionine-8-amino-7-oxononanoate aminotransferase
MPSSDIQSLRLLDHHHLWHPFTPMKLWLESEPLVITAAEGMHLIDSDGRRYLDGVSSLWCNVHGHRVPQIDQAIRNQLDKVAHTTMLGLASEPAILLADRLMQIVPPSLKKVFYSDAGATATEIAFKLAAQYWYNTGHPQKTEFIGFSHAYHGDTVGAMSVGRTSAFHRPYFPLLFKVHFAPTPFVYRSDHPDDPQRVMRECLGQLEVLLQMHAPRIAAVCIEPIVQGAAGIIVHPEGFLREVRRLASAYDVLLICDEVAVGFGRTGKMFACEHEAVEPDLMCVGKGLTGGYLPLAATFATQRIFDAFLGDPWEGKTFFHGHTYTGNPLACAAAIASLELLLSDPLSPGTPACGERSRTGERVRVRGTSPVERPNSPVRPRNSEQEGMLAGVARKAQSLANMLEPLRRLKHVGDIRQKGFMVGIELVEDKPTRRPFDPRRRVGAEICTRIRNHGVILRPLGDVIVLMPPLAMGLDDLRTIVAAVKAELESL